MIALLLVAVSFTRLIAQLPAYPAKIERTLLPLLSAAGVPVPSLSSVISSLSDYSVSAIPGIIDGVTLVALVTVTTLLLVEADSFPTKIMTIPDDAGAVGTAVAVTPNADTRSAGPGAGATCPGERGLRVKRKS